MIDISSKKFHKNGIEASLEPSEEMSLFEQEDVSNLPINHASNKSILKKFGRIPKISKDTLKMDKLELYEIPEDIEALESERNPNLEEYHLFLQNIRTDVDTYISTFTTMLLMEEAASSKGVRIFDLKNVKLARNGSSTAENAYKIEYKVKTFFFYFY